MISIPFLGKLLRDECGAAALDYGLMLALIVLVLLGALNGFGSEIRLTWNTVSNQVQSANNQAAA